MPNSTAGLDICTTGAPVPGEFQRDPALAKASCAALRRARRIGSASSSARGDLRRGARRRVFAAQAGLRAAPHPIATARFEAARLLTVRSPACASGEREMVVAFTAAKSARPSARVQHRREDQVGRCGALLRAHHASRRADELADDRADHGESRAIRKPSARSQRPRQRQFQSARNRRTVERKRSRRRDRPRAARQRVRDHREHRDDEPAATPRACRADQITSSGAIARSARSGEDRTVEGAFPQRDVESAIATSSPARSKRARSPRCAVTRGGQHVGRVAARRARQRTASQQRRDAAARIRLCRRVVSRKVAAAHEGLTKRGFTPLSRCAAQCLVETLISRRRASPRSAASRCAGRSSACSSTTRAGLG